MEKRIIKTAKAEHGKKWWTWDELERLIHQEARRNGATTSEANRISERLTPELYH